MTFAAYTCRQCGEFATGQLVDAAAIAAEHQRQDHGVIPWRLDTHCTIVLRHDPADAASAI